MRPFGRPAPRASTPAPELGQASASSTVLVQPTRGASASTGLPIGALGTLRSVVLCRNHDAVVHEELEMVIAKAEQLSTQQYSELEDRLRTQRNLLFVQNGVDSWQVLLQFCLRFVMEIVPELGTMGLGQG